MNQDDEQDDIENEDEESNEEESSKEDSLSFEKETRNSRERKLVKDTLQEIRSSTITHTNYKKYTDMVKNKVEIIEMTLNSILTEFDDLRSKIKKKENAPKIKAAMEEEFVPLDMYELVKRICNVLQSMTTWNILESELLTVLQDKLIDALGAVKALDIEKEVTAGIREMHKASFDTINEIVTKKLENYEKRFEDFKSNLDMRFDNLNMRLIKDFSDSNDRRNKLNSVSGNVLIRNSKSNNKEADNDDDDTTESTNDNEDTSNKDKDENDDYEKEAQKPIKTSKIDKSFKSDKLDKKPNKLQCPHCTRSDFKNDLALRTHIEFEHNSNDGEKDET